MKNSNEEKGITLVALIITIIVLLILAVVTISAVNEGKLFAHANNAATAYDKAATEENAMIADYLAKIEQYTKDASITSNILAGKYYMCMKDGCTLFAELNSDLTANVLEIGATTYEFDETTQTGSIVINGNSNSFTYEVIKNESNEIQNIIVSIAGMTMVKSPNAISSILGIYESESNDKMKFEIDTTEDGIQYIMEYDGDTDEATGWKRVGGFYCVYNTTEECYDLYNGDSNEVIYKFDGTNTVTKVEEETIFTRQS